MDTFAKNKTSFGGLVSGNSMERFTDDDTFTTLRRMVFRGDDVKGSEYDFRSVFCRSWTPTPHSTLILESMS